MRINTFLHCVLIVYVHTYMFYFRISVSLFSVYHYVWQYEPRKG